MGWSTMSFNSHRISMGFKGQIDRLKTAKISTSDITGKIVSKIPSTELAEKLTTKITAADIADRMKKGVDQVANYAKNVAEKMPTDKLSSKGVTNLDSRGYEVYNIDDSNQVYVARVSEKASFSEDNLIITVAEPGVFVGATEKVAQLNEPAAETEPEVDSEFLFANVLRGGSVDVPVTIGMYKDGVVEECSASDYSDDYMDTIIIRPVVEEISEEDAVVVEEMPIAEAPVVAVLPNLGRIEVEPLETETVDSTEMIQSADCYINSMTAESAVTSSCAAPLECDPMKDDSYSKESLTPVRENKATSRSPRFVFKDGKLQMVAKEEDASSYTVNRSVCIEDEVSGVMKLTLPELESYDECPADTPCEQIQDDGMEAIPFQSKEQVKGTVVPDKESDCGKVTFDFENRSSDYGLIGFSF